MYSLSSTVIATILFKGHNIESSIIEEYAEKINNKLTSKYKKHVVFEDLKKYINFYELSSNLSFINRGTTALNLDIQILASMKTILESITLLLQDGKINDAYSLTRRYHDIIIINIYEILYLEDNQENGDVIIEKINNWLHNQNKLPEYKIMNNYIRNSQKLKNMNNLMFQTKDYKELRQRLNDHTHYNYFYYMVFNDKYKFDFDNKRIELLNQLSKDLKNIFIQHFCWLYTIKDHYMMADDYIDYMEFGEIPPENSQYRVRVYIQEIFDDIVKQNRPDLAKELKESTSMQLS